MDYKQFLALTAQHGLPAPTPAQYAQLAAYAALLIKWNKAINLIGRSTAADVWQRHLLDSYQLVPHIPADCPSALDIGAGAGLPSIIIAIMRPDTHVTACEINTKKASFITAARRELNLENFTVANQDVRTLAATYRLITARAYATMNDILQQTQPLSDKTTTYLLPKGQSWQQELADAGEIISAKSMTTHTISSITNPQGTLVVLKSN